MSSIVIDKSYLQGTKTTKIIELALKHRLLMSDALLYELLTTKPKDRCLCFNKFPDNSNPVDLINHIGEFMKEEIDTHLVSGLPSQSIENFNFIFNENLTRKDYSPPPYIQEEIDRETRRIKLSVGSFLERVKVIPSFFSDLLNGSQKEQQRAHMEAEVSIVAPQSLVPLLNELKLPNDEKSFFLQI